MIYADCRYLITVNGGEHYLSRRNWQKILNCNSLNLLTFILKLWIEMVLRFLDIDIHNVANTSKDIKNKPKMAYSRDISKNAIMDYQGLSLTVKDCHGLSWIVMDCHRLS